MQPSTYPEHWFDNVKKVYVIETVDYYTRKGTTTIIIKYKSLWKRARKLKFPRTRSVHNIGLMHEQSPEAKAILAKIKLTLDPTFKKALFEHESKLAALKSILPTLTDMPRFFGWPTAK